MGRQSYYDNLRFVLIILVVLGHAFINHVSSSPYIPSLLVFIYTFHMPLFLFVSGLFHTNNEIKKRGVLLLSFLLIAKLIEFCEGLIVYDKREFTLFTENGWGWYLAALLVYTYVTFLIKDINLYLILAMTIIIGCMAGYDNTIMNSQLYGRLIVFYPFYYLGSILKKEEIVIFIQRHRKLKFILGIVILAVSGGYCVANRMSILKVWGFIIPRTMYADLPFHCNVFTRLLYYIFVCILGLGCMLAIPTMRIKWISDFGQRTLSVYLYHILIRAFSYKFGITDILCSSKLGISIYIFLCIISTIILSMKLFSAPTEWINKMCYGKKREK